MLEPALWHWIALLAFVGLALAVDLVLVGRSRAEPTFRDSATWTAVWFAAAVVVAALIWQAAGTIEPAARFFTGYLVELSLSLDNVLVFVVIFSYFNISQASQRKVLLWGILGAVVMRLALILVGIELIHRLTWALPVMGLVVFYLGVRLAISHRPKIDPETNWLLRLARRWLPLATDAPPDRFFIVRDGRRLGTTLLLVLLAIESVDLVFALDSVPAVFAVTTDPFIVFASNVLAILGLRSLYFLLSGLMDRFAYISYGISGVLIFMGASMAASWPAARFGWIQPGAELVPYWLSLTVVIVLLSGSIVLSLVAPRPRKA